MRFGCGKVSCAETGCGEQIRMAAGRLQISREISGYARAVQYVTAVGQRSARVS